MLYGTLLAPALCTGCKLKENKNDPILRSVFTFSGGFESSIEYDCISISISRTVLNCAKYSGIMTTLYHSDDPTCSQVT